MQAAPPGGDEFPVPTWIYRGHRKDETYLFVAREDDFSSVPGALLDALGTLTLVMTLDLHPERRLARAQATEVIEALRSRGFYLQLPPNEPGLDPRRH
ncbi:MAG: YcgL domain-containing protein [Ectothiorhodospiraceae bacterium]|nr:YcgL domain-containing protein [Ectothiorhodospiraceae bacterium]